MKDKNLSKAIQIFNNLKKGESIIVSDIDVYVFSKFLQKMAKSTIHEGLVKVFLIKKISDNSVLVLFKETETCKIKIDKNFNKVSSVYSKIKLHQSITVNEIDVYIFIKYLQRLSLRRKINGYKKTFIIKKTGDDSVSVYCTSIQAS